MYFLLRRSCFDDNLWVVSVDLDFDADTNDFKIFRIVQMDQMPLGETLSRVEIYSVNQDSWKPTGRLVPFHPGSPSCTFIVKGVPSWVDAGSENLGATDPCIEKYRMVPAMTLMDSVVLVLYSPGMDRNHWIDVYVLDESCGYWIKKHTTQPIVAA